MGGAKRISFDPPDSRLIFEPRDAVSRDAHPGVKSDATLPYLTVGWTSPSSHWSLPQGPILEER